MPEDSNKADKYAQAVRIAQAAMTAVDPRGPAGHAITLATVAARPPVEHARPAVHVDTKLHEDVIAQREVQLARIRDHQNRAPAEQAALAAQAQAAKEALPPMPPPLPDAYEPSAEVRRASAAMDAPMGQGQAWRYDRDNARIANDGAVKLAQDSETLRKLAMIQQEPPKWQAGSMTGMHFPPMHVVSKKEVDAASSKAENDMDKRLSPAEYAEKVNDLRISGSK